jgi:hypothetical protein
LVISDGAPGLIGAAEVVLAKRLCQRCLIHRARNILAKVPKVTLTEVKAQFWKIFDDISRCRSWPGSGDEARRTDRFVREALSHHLPGGSEVPHHQHRKLCCVPTIPEGTLEPHPSSFPTQAQT